ncbi:peptidoglycan-binding protein [Streptomyces sp. NPDC096311]|uniref:peptidoglycan-binding protein n=1 Tax=Streptomyces sp. NPDC096311 TaxID=3366083 RepID=UPI003819F412
MEAPVFEEFDPVSDCDCPGCVHWRRVIPSSSLPGPVGHPAARRALLLAAAAGTVLAVGQPVPAVAAAHGPARPGDPRGDRPGDPRDDDPDTPQGDQAPLHGPDGGPAGPAQPGAGGELPATTRAAIIDRAKKWVASRVPYSKTEYWPDGYRQDCSGFVSMAWNLPGNEWTGSLSTFGVRISRDQLQPGDMLLFHNSADPQKGSHVVLFGGWSDYTHTYYLAYEQTRPHARGQSAPYAYWSNSDRYVPYRYKGLAEETSGAGVSASGAGSSRYPGRSSFGPGADNPQVTRLARLLVERGADRFYSTGPGPSWSDADRRATQAFQRAQGWRGTDADGLPGPQTWSHLVGRKGRDIPAAGRSVPGTPVVGGAGTKGFSAPSVPGYPGRGLLRPGADNEFVTRLGEQLVKKGFGTYYTSGPGPRWGEADRRGVEAFQRAQGWRGGAADGCPGPETWRRLFS